MLHIILIQPETPGNIGGIARSMANFDTSKLILVNPNCNHLSDEARNRAKHANFILKNTKTTRSLKSLRPKFDLLIATTGRLGSDYNISRTPLLPPQLAKKLHSLPKNKNIGLVFGRESDGLTTEELRLCDFVTTIPTSPKYPSMNLSHAVTIMLYELAKPQETITDKFIPADRKDREQLHTMVSKTFDTLTFPTKEKRLTQDIVWKKVFEKALLTKRESRALMGFFAILRKERKRKQSKKSTK